jgi:hypothetical protein
MSASVTARARLQVAAEGVVARDVELAVGPRKMRRCLMKSVSSAGVGRGQVQLVRQVEGRDPLVRM